MIQSALALRFIRALAGCTTGVAMKPVSICIVLTLLLSLPTAFADTLYVHLAGTGGIVDPSGAYYIYPYYAQVQSFDHFPKATEFTRKALDVWCVDFIGTVYQGDTWPAMIVQNQPVSNPPAHFPYAQMAWIIGQYQDHAPGYTSAGTVQWAVWQLTGGTAPAAISAQVQSILEESEGKSHPYTVYEPIPSNNPRAQAFMRVPVPEPSSLSLLLAGLSCLALAAIQRRHSLRKAGKIDVE